MEEHHRHRHHIGNSMRNSDLDEVINCLIPDVASRDAYVNAVERCIADLPLPENESDFGCILTRFCEIYGFHFRDLPHDLTARVFNRIELSTLESLLKMKDFDYHDGNWCSNILVNMWNENDSLVSNIVDQILSFSEDRSSDFRDLFIKTKYLLTIANPKSENIVHEIIKHAPNVVTWLALKSHPEELTKEDSLGNLLLHWAASFPPVSATYYGRKSERNKSSLYIILDMTPNAPKKLELSKNSLEIVLDMNPNAAKHSNKHGRFPLHIFLENSSLVDGIKRESMALSLVNAAPELLEVKDSKTSLFPFMLASTMQRSSSQTFKMHHQVNLIYIILRKNPTVINSLLTKSYYKGELLKAGKKICIVNKKLKRLENNRNLIKQQIAQMEQETLQNEARICDGTPKVTRKRTRVAFK